MTQDEACKFQMPFGKYNGKSLEEIATKEPDGPRYLDWMVGQDYVPELRIALKCFLAIPWVAELVDRAVENHVSGVRTEPIENIKKPKFWWEK
jgi:uncharacterized protein (DUF3820 family)